MAALMPDLATKIVQCEPIPRPLHRRIEPSAVAEIVEKYQFGVTTPSLCRDYSLSKGGLLKLLREAGVQLRRQPLNDHQVREATALYVDGMSLGDIDARFNVSYNGVRQALVRAGVERRARGGRRR